MAAHQIQLVPVDVGSDRVRPSPPVLLLVPAVQSGADRPPGLRRGVRLCDLVDGARTGRVRAHLVLVHLRLRARRSASSWPPRSS